MDQDGILWGCCLQVYFLIESLVRISTYFPCQEENEKKKDKKKKKKNKKVIDGKF